MQQFDNDPDVIVQKWATVSRSHGNLTCTTCQQTPCTGLIGEGRSISHYIQFHGDGTASLETTNINKGKPTSTTNVALKSDAQILVRTFLWASQRRIDNLITRVF
jgi:hypothetical protein